MAEFAPGIPSKTRIPSLPKIEGAPRRMQFSIQRHDADRAGTHYDVRLGDPETGDAHSWAVKHVPEPGKGTYAPIQPGHTLEYQGFSGRIETGYGSGKVKSERLEPAEVISSSDNEVRFMLPETRHGEQFVLKRQGGKMWTLHNSTPSRDTKKWRNLLPVGKISPKSQDVAKLDPSDESTVWQPKIDGAHELAVFEPGKFMRLFSYRDAKNKTGLIEHTFHNPNYLQAVLPKGSRTSVLRGELAAVDNKGRPLPSSQTSAILNSSIEKARKKLKDSGASLTFFPFGAERIEGRSAGKMTVEEVDSFLDSLAKQVPGIKPIPTAKTVKQKEKLRGQIISGRHPLTEEGIIARSRHTGKEVKAKIKDDYDVFIREVYPGARENEAGGFRYSHSEHGEIVGNVGTGFTAKQRKDMLRNPQKWVGRVVKVRAQERLPSGALRAPAFKEPHESKGMQPYHEL